MTIPDRHRLRMAADTREPHLQLFSNMTSPQQIIIRTEYTLPATSCLLHLSYIINANGEMLVDRRIDPDTTQPPISGWPLSSFGIQWILPPVTTPSLPLAPCAPLPRYLQSASCLAAGFNTLPRA